MVRRMASGRSKRFRDKAAAHHDRPGLKKGTRHLINVAVLTLQGRSNDLSDCIDWALSRRVKVDRIVARMMRPQAGAQRIMKRLGFHDEFLIPEHVRDQDGIWQDMIIMRCNLDDLWREMEGVFEDSDIQWHR